MRSPWPALLLALAVNLPAAAYHEASEPSDGTVNSFREVAPPHQLPELAVRGLDGVMVPLAAFRGRVVLLNIWATWCPPCLRELPALDRLQARLGGDDFVVVAVSIDEGGADIAAPYFEQLGIDQLELYVDPERTLGAALPTDVLPATFMLDRTGRVRSFLRSYVDWDTAEADAYIGRLISSAE